MESNGTETRGFWQAEDYGLRIQVLVGGESALAGIGARDAQAVRDQVSMRFNARRPLSGSRSKQPGGLRPETPGGPSPLPGDA